MKCPVCKCEYGNSDTVCECCGFTDLHREFINRDEYKLWRSTTVKSFRTEWKASGGEDRYMERVIEDNDTFVPICAMTKLKKQMSTYKTAVTLYDESCYRNEEARETIYNMLQDACMCSLDTLKKEGYSLAFILTNKKECADKLSGFLSLHNPELGETQKRFLLYLAEGQYALYCGYYFAAIHRYSDFLHDIYEWQKSWRKNGSDFLIDYLTQICL